MRESHIRLPLHYALANALGRLLVMAGAPMFKLDEQSLLRAAMGEAGLSDFGDPHFRRGMLRLLESLEADANLHALGRLMARDIITTYLVQRLRLIEARKQQPSVFDQPLIPPLIVTGMARSGTTFLHRMLALDPAHRGLPQWLLIRPFPGSDGAEEDADPRIAKMARALRIRQPLLSGIDAIHYNRADTLEECILALGLTFNSLIFGTLLPVYGYMEWYQSQTDLGQKYREYRWLLQVFQSQDPNRRLSLKAPAHAGNLQPLTEAVPGVMLIQTHRDPLACVSSACSLLHTYYLGVSDEVDVRRMAQTALGFYEAWTKRNVTFREAHPGMIHDVPYEALVSSPFETVRGIYTRFDLPWTESYASKLEAYIGSHPKGKHGVHSYAAQDFGLTVDEITQRMQFYVDHLGW